MIRSEPLTSFDAPLADRQSIACFIDVWNQLGEDIAEHGRDLDRVQAEHRANMIARYGLSGDHFERGPTNPKLTNSDRI